MANIEEYSAKGNALFHTQNQYPFKSTCLAVFDSGGVTDDAKLLLKISGQLNREASLKDLAEWLLRQKTLFINRDRRDLLQKIVDED